MSEDPLTSVSAPPPSVPAESTPIHTESPTPAEGPHRPHRRRRRRRRRGGRPGSGNGAPERADELAAPGPEKPVEGVLYLPAKETAPGVLVTARANYLPSHRDPIVPRDLVAREGLEAGALITGWGSYPTSVMSSSKTCQ